MHCNNLKYTYPAGIVLILAGYFIFAKTPSLFSRITFCPFKTLTGIPCPACGSTRATSLLLQGHLHEAVMLNPLVLLVHLIIPVFLFWMLYDILKGRDTFLPNLKKDWNPKVKVLVFGIILCNWIWNIYKGL
jgi:hypothetical protein